MFSIIFLAGIVYLFRSTQKNKVVAINKGVEDDDLTFFTIFLLLYALPPIAAFLFVEDYSIWIALVFLACYIPGIVLGRRLSIMLSKGYDYERKAGKEYEKAMLLGFVGIALVVFNWASFSFFSYAERMKRVP